MGRRFIRLGVFAALGSAFLLPGVSRALVQPPEGSVLPDYDIRQELYDNLRSLDRSSVPRGIKDALKQHAGFAPAPAQLQAAGSLEGRLGNRLVVRFDLLSSSPRMIKAQQGFLTQASKAPAQDVALSFLRENAALFGLEASGLNALKLGGQYRDDHNGVTHLQYFQSVQGVPVYQSTVRFHVDGEGRLVGSASSSLISSPAAGFSAVLTPSQAVTAAAGFAGIEFSGDPVQISPSASNVMVFDRGPCREKIEVSRLLFPVGQELRSAWEVWLEPAGYPARYQVIIDAADGMLLSRHNAVWYLATEGLVFPENPDADGQQVLTTFADDSINVTPESPLGWVFTDRTAGNNIEAKADREDDNEQTAGFMPKAAYSTNPDPLYSFNFPFTDKYAQTGQIGDLSAAITNAFYIGNFMHDYLYRYGFTEAAGNFQDDNFGKGGYGGDFVYIDVQNAYDTGGRNNAFFSTSPDGQNGRASMMTFTSPNRDSAFDFDILAHELLHGVSHRLIGGPMWAGYSACLRGQHGGAIGEGTSDFYPLHITDETRMGEYTTANAARGIRSETVDGNAYTLADFCKIIFIVSGCETHNNGEIWASTLWDMRALLRLAEPSDWADITSTLVTDGMKFAPCLPTFLDLRDGILMADLVNYGGIHHCLIWQAFADRGMGIAAVATDPDDSAPVADSTMPPECDQGVGELSLARDRYCCGDDGVVTVMDSNATGPLAVTVSSGSDTLALSLNATGIRDTFSATFPIACAAADPSNQVLEVSDPDTIAVDYLDANPSQVLNDAAVVTCTANIDVRYQITNGSCDDDSVQDFPELRGFLDAGEIADLNIILTSKEAFDIINGTLAIASMSPDVTVLDTASVQIGTVPGAKGSSPAPNVVASFKVRAASTVTPGQTADIQLSFASDSFSQLATDTISIELQRDYLLLAGQVTPTEGFEAGGAWPADWDALVFQNPSEWNVVACDAAAGTYSAHEGDPNCTGNYQEGGFAYMYSRNYNFLAPGIEAYLPRELVYDQKLDIGASGNRRDTAATYTNEEDLLNGLYSILRYQYQWNNTGGAWVSSTDPITIEDTYGYDLTQGFRVLWILFRDGSGASTGTGWFIDNVRVTYDSVEIVDQGAVCGGQYEGTLSACTDTMPAYFYNTARPGEIQTCCGGAFFRTQPNGWFAYDTRFATASQPLDTLALMLSDNPDDAAHDGVMAVNGRMLADPIPPVVDFQTTTCASIPVPVPDTLQIRENSSLTLTWPAFQESGTQDVIIGYRVYRINSTQFPPSVSDIDDYTSGAGEYRGSTVNQADINTFVDTTPDVPLSNPQKFTWVVQPVLAGIGPLSFDAGPSNPAKPNISTDSVEVLVEEGMYVDFDFWKAEATPQGVQVTWGTRTEVDTLGFYVLRGESPDGTDLSPVNTLPITATGSGSTYTFLDAGISGAGNRYQVLELTGAGEPSKTPIFAVDGLRSRSIRRDRSAGGQGAARPLERGR